MIKFIGIANIVFFAFVSLILMARAQGFSFKKNTLSSLSGFRSSGRIFDLCLFIFSTNQVIFGVVVANTFIGNVSNLVIPLFIAGGALLCLASIFPINRYPNLHFYLATFCLLLVGLGVLLLGVGLLNVNLTLASILLIFTLLIPILFFGRNMFPGGSWEIPLFICIFAWNIVLSIFIF